MEIEEVKPEDRVEGFVRKFDVADWRDPELNLYLTLTRATDAAPPEEEKPPWIDPYDDPYPLYRKVPKGTPPSPTIIKLQHQVSLFFSPGHGLPDFTKGLKLAPGV